MVSGTNRWVKARRLGPVRDRPPYFSQRRNNVATRRPMKQTILSRNSPSRGLHVYCQHDSDGEPSRPFTSFVDIPASTPRFLQTSTSNVFETTPFSKLRMRQPRGSEATALSAAGVDGASSGG